MVIIGAPRALTPRCSFHTLQEGLRGVVLIGKADTMSNYDKRMASLTNGNVASAATLKAAFSPPDSDRGTARATETDPALKTKPGLS